MQLKNFQYKQILQHYDEIRLKNRHLEEKRYNEIIKAIPKIKEIDNTIASNSISYAKMALTNHAISTKDLEEKNQQLSKQKEQLLIENGFPKDYLNSIYTCKHCQDTGFIENEKCNCFKQAIIDFLYKQANLGNILKQENFHKFRFDYYDNTVYDNTVYDKSMQMSPFENIQKIVLECQKFIASFEDSYDNILLFGNTGVGKTFLINCVAKELLDMTHTVVYLTSFQLFDILAKHTFSKSEEEKSEADYQFQYIFDCDLLIIDDLGTENVNSFIASQLYQCINERHLTQKSTIISTNLSINEIKSLYSERVFSRLLSNYKVFKIIGDDIRLKKVITP